MSINKSERLFVLSLRVATTLAFKCFNNLGPSFSSCVLPFQISVYSALCASFSENLFSSSQSTAPTFPQKYKFQIPYSKYKVLCLQVN